MAKIVHPKMCLWQGEKDRGYRIPISLVGVSESDLNQTPNQGSPERSRGNENGQDL